MWGNDHEEKTDAMQERSARRNENVRVGWAAGRPIQDPRAWPPSAHLPGLRAKRARRRSSTTYVPTQTTSLNKLIGPSLHKYPPPRTAANHIVHARCLRARTVFRCVPGIR